jgi:hypothetical protein
MANFTQVIHLIYHVGIPHSVAMTPIFTILVVSYRSFYAFIAKFPTGFTETL